MAQARKLAAILAADIVGYSRLAGADEDGTLSRLRALRSDLIDPAIAAHNGRVVKRIGDGILIEFRSVVDAVRCAIDVQNGMVERNAGMPPDRRIVFRVGIHLGDVVEEEDGDLMGDGVNIAARLEGIAKPGAICLSEDAYRQVKSRLDLAVRDLGAVQLKNIAEPIRVYSLEVGKPALAKRNRSTGAKQRSIIALLGAGVVGLIVIVGGSWYFLGADRSATITSTAPARPATVHQSIVVLPFANLSGDPSQDYFADGITDGITTELSRTRYVFVIARNTAFTFKGKNIDAKQIGKELGVHNVLEGSVQRYQDRVRVNVQLIDADSGAHVWADQFDAARADLFQMQNEIVVRLAYTMGWEWVKAEAQRSALSTNPDAEDLALQCWAAVIKVGGLGKEADAGYRLCERALDADPTNLDALTMLPGKFILPVKLHRSADPQSDLKRADELASRALAFDPNYFMAHDVKGSVLWAEGRLGDAIAEYEHALTLNPNDVGAFANLAFVYGDLGQYEKAIEFADTAIRLSPYDPGIFYWYWMRSIAYLAQQQDDQAIESARRSIASNQNFGPPYAILAAGLAFTGNKAEARDAVQRYSALTNIKSMVDRKAWAPPPSADPRRRALDDRVNEGLRKAGMPEE